jgi:hypothetical protein
MISDSTGANTPHNYWMEDRILWQSGCEHFYSHGWDTFAFVPYSSRDNWWVRFHPQYPLHREPMVVAPAARDDTHVDEVNNDLGLGASGTPITEDSFTTAKTQPASNLSLLRNKPQNPPPPFTLL